MEPIRESATCGLNEIAEILDVPLSPNEEFDLAYSMFQTDYFEYNAEEMPDELKSGGPYSDYRALEDAFATCNSPTRLNTIKMECIRDIMQRYAEAQRNE